MIPTPWLAAAMALAGASGPVAQREPQANRAAFAELVKEYKSYVTPRCAPEIVVPYRSYSARRDAAFVRSLNGTDLRAVYVKAVREQSASDASTVYHCSGPPPPPPPPGTSAPAIDPRTRVITEAQERLRKAADNIPAYFDQGDALFTRMTVLRDQILDRKES